MLRFILLSLYAVVIVRGNHLNEPGVDSIHHNLHHDTVVSDTTTPPPDQTASFGRGFGGRRFGGFRGGPPGGPGFGFPPGGGRFMGDFPAIGGPQNDFNGPPRGPPNFDQIRVENGGFPVWGGAGINRVDGTRAFDGWDGDPAKLGIASFSREVGPSSAFPSEQQGAAPDTTVQTTCVVLRPPLVLLPEQTATIGTRFRTETRAGVPIHQIESGDQYTQTVMQATRNVPGVAIAVDPIFPTHAQSKQTMADQGNTGGFGGVFGPQNNNNNNNNGGGGGGGPFSDPLTGQPVQVVSNDMANAVRQGRTGGGDQRMGGFGQGQGQGFQQFGGQGQGFGGQGGPGFGGQGGPGFGGPQGGPQGFQGGPPPGFQGGPQGFQGGQFGPGPQGGGRQGPMQMGGPQGGMMGPGPGQFGFNNNNNNNNNNQFNGQGPMGGPQGGLNVAGPGGPIRIRIPADGGQPIVTRDGVTQPLPQGMSLSDLGIATSNINNNNNNNNNGFGGSRNRFGNNDQGFNNNNGQNNMMQGGQGQGHAGLDHQHGGMNNNNNNNNNNNMNDMNNNNSNNNNNANAANNGVPDLVVLQIEDLRNRDNLPAIMRALQNIANGAQTDQSQGSTGGLI